jgi:CRP/FNR family transcriptional regulator, cyclic AMP receptor protein
MAGNLGIPELVSGRVSDRRGESHMPQRMSRELVDVLAGMPLFAGLSRRHLNRIGALATAKRYPPGTRIVRVGDPGEAFFVIMDGRVAVRAGARRTVLQTGDFFGEMSLLDGRPRSATAVAQTEVLLMVVSRPKFLKLLITEPRIAIAVMCTLSERVRALQDAACV